MKQGYIFLLWLSVGYFPTHGQIDSSASRKPDVSFSGFVDIFYSYDFNKPGNGYRQSFFYNHNRHNEFNINLGLVKASVKHEKYRANVALQAGTYAADNYAAEQPALQHVYEANAGISLNKKNTLWLDAGIFPSHLGFESAISKDNWTLTRSFVAENSPYYLSGTKLTYATGKWEIAAHFCNGWQRIKRVPRNSLPSFGTQVKYIANDTWYVNWSTFVGTDDPDSTRRMRYFNNLYLQSKINNNVGVIVGLDVGTQQVAKNSTDYNTWYSPILIVHYTMTDKWAATLRGEYYQDENGVIVAVSTPNGFKTTGLSVNLDYTPVTNVMWRVEGRWLSSVDPVFEKQGNPTSRNFFITTSLVVSF